MKKETLMGPVAFIVLWACIAYMGVFSPLLMPTPVAVGRAMFAVGLQSLSEDLAITLARLVLGFSFGVIVGVPLGLTMGYFPKVNDCFGPLVDFFRSIPVTALFPLFLLFVGMGTMAIAVIVAFSSSLVVLLNTLYGVRNCKLARLMYVRSLGATGFQMVTNVIFPESLPHILAGMRTSLSIGLIVVVVTEMFQGATSGLGMRIYDAHLMFRTPEMYAWILVTGLLGYAVNRVFASIERRIVHWMGR